MHMYRIDEFIQMRGNTGLFKRYYLESESLDAAKETANKNKQLQTAFIEVMPVKKFNPLEGK